MPVELIELPSLRAEGPSWRTMPAPRLDGLPGLTSELSLVTTLRMLRDPAGFTAECSRRFGNLYKAKTFGAWNAVLLGPRASELLLFDREGAFSSEQGWDPLLGGLFAGGLMLQDGETHASHRKLMATAFKPHAQQAHLQAMELGVTQTLEDWRGREILMAGPEIKRMSLELAATTLLGVSLTGGADRMGIALSRLVGAAVGLIRADVPGTAMGRGLRSRRFLRAFFRREAPLRRGSTQGDIFTQLCNLDEFGSDALTADMIADHMIFLIMAAHDTTSSALTCLMYYLATDQDLQEAVRQEVLGCGAEIISPGDLATFDLTDRALKETLRLHPPVPSIPRRAVKPFEFEGHEIPAGAYAVTHLFHTHRMSDYWPCPDQFDADRFLPAATRARDRYAWTPFGAGAHTCLGLHFAFLEAKLFLRRFLEKYRVRSVEGYRCDFQIWPITKPRDGLPVRLEERN